MTGPETDNNGHSAAHAHASHQRSHSTGDHRSAAHSGKPLHPPVRSIAVWGPIAAVSILAIFVILGAWRHMRERREQEEFSKETSQLSVNVINAQRDSKPHELVLPGTFQAFQEATLYARANGYVKAWHADIGDYVKQGQRLAEIETPEVDQQLAQAKASYDIAKVTADRWRDLVVKKVVAAQDYDEKEKAYEGARAQYEQLQKTQAFNEITAPFAGRISSRLVDVGALVTAGSGTAGTALFSLVQSDPLRVYVYAPQENAASLHTGLSAQILLQEFPGQTFEGTLMRTAGALDPQSRTMQVEVQVPNHENKLFAGMFGQVKFNLPNDNAPILIPSNAFVFRPEGAQVAVVSNDKHIHWQKIRIGRDFGTQLEVLDGLAENAKVVMNPTDDLSEGVQVEVKPAPKPAENNPSGGGQGAASH